MNITQLTMDGLPTRFETCTLDRRDDGWTVTVVGFYEVYGVAEKQGQTVPVSFDTADGRHAGMAKVASVEREAHTEERMVVQLEGVHPLK
jgi:hypothetical protein